MGGGILDKATLGRYWVGDAVVLVLATALLLSRARDTVWWLGAEYWYEPLHCYCAVGGILDNVTAAAQLAGY